MTRRNFTTAVRVEIVKRATRDGVVYCEHEGCGLPTKKYEVHHLKMDAMEVDKSRKLTALDGALFCIPCHDRETKVQRPILAQALAREASHLRVPRHKVKIPSPPKREKLKRDVLPTPPRRQIFEAQS